MKVNRPDWFSVLPEILKEPLDDYKALDLWFDEHIAPYEFYDPKDAVEVTGYWPDRESITEAEWGHVNYCDKNDTHKALLINIEPIEQENCIDVLKDLINFNTDNTNYDERILDAVIDAFKRRAKAALEREGK